MRVTSENRDALARIARQELGGVSLDEALRVILFEHQLRLSLAHLAADPGISADYLREATELAAVDTTVRE